MKHKFQIKTFTMDNGGENNYLWSIVNPSKLFNCNAYRSGEKGTFENKQRILKRIFWKSESLDKHTKVDLIVAQNLLIIITSKHSIVYNENTSQNNRFTYLTTLQWIVKLLNKRALEWN